MGDIGEIGAAAQKLPVRQGLEPLDHRPAAGHVFDPNDKGAQAFAALEGLVRKLVETGEFAPGNAWQVLVTRK